MFITNDKLESTQAREVKEEIEICQACKGNKIVEKSRLDFMDLLATKPVEEVKKLVKEWNESECVTCPDCDGVGYFIKRI